MNYLYIVVIGLILLEVILIRWSIKNNKLTREQSRDGLKLLREFTEHGPRITAWLKENIEDLQKYPIETLNKKELLDMIKNDQELYDKIIKIYPDHECMAPVELHRHIVEIAEGKHKHVH